MTEQSKPFTADELAGFTGTEVWYRHGLVPGVTYTEGVKYLAARAGAYWLIDKIATLQLVQHVRREDFQSWKLTVAANEATLVCEDGDSRVVYSETISFTDFPLPEITLWAIRGTDGAGDPSRVVMLTSEY